MLRTLATAGVITLAAAGCSSGAPAREQGSKTIRPGELVAVEGPAPVGRFYVKAGENSLDADLYEFAFHPARQDRLTTQARVTTLDGCGAKVVVSAAQKEVGLTDHLQELQGGRLAPVEKLGLERGSDPHLADDCRILFSRLAEGGAELISEIVLFDPATATTTSVVKGSTVASASWGPNGEILILKREPAGPILVIRKPDGTETVVETKQPDVGNPLWGRSGWIATDIAQPRQAPTGTLFLNPTTGERAELSGWLPLAWSPDGRQLLVAEAVKGTTLAVVDLPDLTKTRNVGVSEVGTVWDAAWLPPA